MSLTQLLTSDSRKIKANWVTKPKPVIGPNAVTQLLSALRHDAEPDLVQRVLATAEVTNWADWPPAHMIDERPVAAFHRATRLLLGAERSDRVLADAGRRTADYILANRIPRAARHVLKALPARMSAHILARAIAAHAWTFAGSGRFACTGVDGLSFEIWGNPLCSGEDSSTPLCVWHAAVFKRLYQTLVSPKAIAVETHCLARGDACCRFAVRGIRK